MTDKLATAAQAQLAQPEESEFMALLKQALQMKDANIDVIERMFNLQERRHAQERKRLFFEALARLQARLEPIVKAGENSYTKSRYVRLDDLLAVIKPLCEDEGFAFTFDSKPSAKGITFTCEMVHRMGHSETKSLELPIDTHGDKTGRSAIQAVGSSTSYARRYLLDMHLNLARRGEDDDGAGGSPLLTADQVATVKSALESVGGDAARFLAFMKAGTFEEILAKDYTKAHQFIEAKRRKVTT